MYGCIPFLALNKLQFEHKECEISIVCVLFYFELFFNNAKKDSQKK